MEITKYLDENRVGYEMFSHRPAFTAQQMAAEDHIAGMDVAKPVVIKADGKYYMCVLPACCKVDLDALATHLKADIVELANEDELARLFPDCELGAEPPFGNLYGMATFMDESLGKDGYLVCQSGTHDHAVKLNVHDYQKLVHPQLLKFSYHLH